jgi:pimeloyl-ACP methyl ester carboxylesterase
MSKVISKDGTEIAYEKKGSGPALILVDGALCYRSFGPMTELSSLLAPKFTVFTYDRRGRGESSNSKLYSLEREVEDIDALIEAAGGPAFVYGISSGACLALEAAIRLGKKVRKLAMYEAPYDNSGDGVSKAWKEYRKKLAESLAEGRNGDAVVLFMKSVNTPTEQIEGMQHAPMWPMLEAVAPTLAYDAAALGDDRTVPAKRAAAVSTQALVMNGTALAFMHDTATRLAKAIPTARQRTLPGQTHDVDLKVLAPVLVEFFSGQDR